MTTYLLTRHVGAVKWMQAMGHHYDKHLNHLASYDNLAKGDTVIGSLPINIVADINQLGVKYVHLSLVIPEELRGVELSLEQLIRLEAKLETFSVIRSDDHTPHSK
ncbi:CRISPR-associated protein Csx16 [Psychrobacter sp. I-STPA6b]|uniref:CRISPR-associated protein Csx16 n=1 Tax=Psychrobacter sp. I-STPA6b TaxID=2585718 RepID=UPI001D0C62A3|nr:CRISPR-associated protein Csx16 [Psychrobacter sp. I-STPA6b]